MEFRTIVDIPKPDFQIEPREEMLFVGSCFADSIGRRFVEEQFRAAVNPYGTMYNPASVLHTVERYEGAPRIAFITLGTNHVYRLKETGEIVDNCQKRPAALFQEEQLSVDDCAGYLRCAIDLLRSRRPDVHVVLTVSPIRYRKYGYHESQLSKATLLLAVSKVCSGEVFSAGFSLATDEHGGPRNCSLATDEHGRTRSCSLATDEHGRTRNNAVMDDHGDDFREIPCPSVAKENPFPSVSEAPFRVDPCPSVAKEKPRVNPCPSVAYFPAYEIVLDELRDYRFYADDMLHPSPQAVEYIWQQLVAYYFSPRAKAFLREWAPLKAALAHRPFNPDSDEYRRFLADTRAKVDALLQKYQ